MGLDLVTAGRKQETPGLVRDEDVAADDLFDGLQLGLQQLPRATVFGQTVEHQRGQFGQIQRRQNVQQVGIGGDDVLQENDLGWHHSVVGRRKHLVDRVEHQVDVDDERVLVLAAGGAGEQEPGLDHELGDVLQAFEAFLDRFLTFRLRHEVRAVSDAAQKSPETKNFSTPLMEIGI